MNKTFTILTAGAFALASVSAFADDTTPDKVTPAEQAKMTPEEKAAAKKARDAETQKYEDAMVKATQNPQGRNAGIAKSAADSKAGPTPRHGTMNTPEADKVLKEQKGQ